MTRILVSCFALAVAGVAGAAQPSIDVGDSWTYEARDGYSFDKDPFAVLQVEVTGISDGEVVTQVTNTTNGEVGTERFTRRWDPVDADWAVAQPFPFALGYHDFLVHPLTRVGSKIREASYDTSARALVMQHFQFSTPYPEFPDRLEPGTSWRGETSARNATTGHQVKVGVTGKVLGDARIHVPAGDFDTVKLERITYFFDEGFRHTNTRVTDTEWFAPRLGRSVKYETKWDYYDKNSSYPVIHPGDWAVYELTSYSKK